MCWFKDYYCSVLISVLYICVCVCAFVCVHLRVCVCVCVCVYVYVCVQVITCNFQMVQGLETIKQTLNVFNVYRTAATIKVSVNMESCCLTRAVSNK